MVQYGKMNTLDDAITVRIQKAIAEHVFPGGVISYYKEDRAQTLAFGRLTYQETAPSVTAATVYDLASVTKSIPIAGLILMLVDQGKLALDDPVITYVPELSSPGSKEVLIRHLLSFTAAFDLPEPLSTLAHEGGAAILRRVFTTPLRQPVGGSVLYADIPYILLGIVIERVSGVALDVFAETMIFKPLGMTHTTFHPARLKDTQFAPTEIVEDKEIMAEAHDEKARVLYKEGEITGHAGLFSTAGDLLTYCRMLLNNGIWKDKRYLSQKSLALMQTEVASDADFGFSLGWTTRAASMGSGLPAGTFGKSGFTGTLVVVSPATHCCVVFLTNRTYPKRPDTSAAINAVRQDLTRLVLS